MSPSHPATTSAPSTSFPDTDAIFSRTPPLPNDYFGNSFTSPSPRTRLGSRDVPNPGPSRNNNHNYNTHYYHHHRQQQQVVDDSSSSSAPVDPTTLFSSAQRQTPSVPSDTTPVAVSYSTFPSTHNPPRTTSLNPNSNPPRISSLLPAARITGESTAAANAHTLPVFRDVLNDPPPPKAPTPARELEPPHHKRGHSRSSSGGLSDGFRNLNRWSASTTSSRASNLADFTRRVSTELLGGAFGSPGRKFHKSKPSTSSAASPRSGGFTATSVPSIEPPAQAPAPIPEFQALLPPISTGPSLEDEVFETNVLGKSPLPIERPKRIARPNEEPSSDWDGIPYVVEEDPGSSSHQRGTAEQQPHGPVFELTAPEITMPYTQNVEPRGHSRNRSAGANRSVDTTGSSRSRERESQRERERAGRPPSQKAMLSKALEKANTAVQLDNVQNFEAARRAYAEACGVLQQVLKRTAGEEDRRKLEAIHETYTNRILELDEQLADIEPEGKELPHRPESNEIFVQEASIVRVADQEKRNLFTDTGERGYGRDQSLGSYSIPASATRTQFTPARAPPPNLSIDTSRSPVNGPPSSYLTEQYSLQSAFSRARINNGNGSATLHAQAQNSYMPPPLSPRRPLSPAKPPPPPPQPDHDNSERVMRNELSMSGARLAPENTFASGHQRGNSHESVSWLDPIDESEGSSASSVHSRSSSQIRRKHIRAPSGDTEAEFDAALDDAIEAAYDDGFDYEGQDYQEPREDSTLADTLRLVELARERVRDSEREALELATEREERLRRQLQLDDEEYRRQEAIGEDFYDHDEAEAEERMLEEMTRGFAMDQFSLDTQRPTIPRESDSSGLTSRTWHSSMGSSAATPMTAVSEKNVIPHLSGPLPPPPSQALPQLPPAQPQPQSTGSSQSTQTVRNRRLSGTNAKQLKIETAKIQSMAPPATAQASIPSQGPKSGNYIVQQRQALSAGPNRNMMSGALSSRPAPSPVPGTGPEDYNNMDMAINLPLGFVQDMDHPRSDSPSLVRPTLRSNFSSSSLKSIKSRNLSISQIDESDHSPGPGTPSSNQFGMGGSSTRLPSIPDLPAAYKDRANSTAVGGLHLFDSQIHLSDTPGSPNPLVADAPVALEPCPNDTLLRPFWLMRCLYQTLCHPRGGYISNKLFVPNHVWKVKGVKLKNIEDKIANCDLLTAALQKLARVDDSDADAVLEEMQSLENMLEQIQSALSRKLGSEVGVQGSSTMFRDASGVETEAPAMPRSASVAGKGSSFSWRRLRSKNSSANLPGLATSYGGKGGSGGANASTLSHESGNKDALLASLPMTSHPTSRPTKRDIGNVLFTGPNANYMSSLARLFDAAQTIDQIARQVEDPGLRHADKTQVGLELCTRHAAEFFAFYICRFALSDLTLLLDKFIKRGSEWVLV